MRTLLLYILGFKLLDATVTYIDCGMCGVPEANWVLRDLASACGGYWVAFPYLLGWGAVLSFLLWRYMEEPNGLSSLGLIVAWPFVAITWVGPVSHVLYWICK